jgi:hypothetical protein
MWLRQGVDPGKINEQHMICVQEGVIMRNLEMDHLTTRTGEYKHPVEMF